MKKTFSLISLSLLLAATAEASELRYKPVNPSFGGNPFYSSHLYTQAEAQKQHDAPFEDTTEDPLEDFALSVTSRVLSQLSSDIAEQIFGENAQDSGQYVIGDTTINFERVGTDVIINIQDAATGGETTVTLPATI